MCRVMQHVLRVFLYSVVLTAWSWKGTLKTKRIAASFFTAAGVFTTSSSIGVPLVARAGSGEANLEFFKKEEVVKVGDNLYNENDKLIIQEKLEKTKTNWNKMIKKVEKAIDSNAITSAKDAISGPLFQLKADMRLLSKLACYGDIYIRAKPGAEANFDYNSGQFELKKLAQDAEITIDCVNDLYFYGLDKGKSSALGELEKTVQAFNNWMGDVDAVLK